MPKPRRREQDELGMRPHCTAPEEAQIQVGRPAPMQPARAQETRVHAGPGPGLEEPTAKTRRREQAQVKLCLPPLRATPKKAHVEAKAVCAQTRSHQAGPPHFGVELADRSQQAAPPLNLGAERASPQCGTFNEVIKVLRCRTGVG